MYLVQELKKENQDFEFYPTTPEIFRALFKYHTFKGKTVLDIGAGRADFKTEFEKSGERLGDYYAIEKSLILQRTWPKDVIPLGTDFHATNLIDKPVDIIFCNPPYSEFVDWTARIILEGNFKTAYFVIPERWKDNAAIKSAIETADYSSSIIGSFNFMNAERSARCKVDLICISPRKYRYGSDHLDPINESAFDRWFTEAFPMPEHTTGTPEDPKATVKSKLVNASDKVQMLVELYTAQLAEYLDHFKHLTAMDPEILQTVGVNLKGVKDAIKQKTQSLKILYWEIVFSELSELTSRLTVATREKMQERYKSLNTVDFTAENIQALVLFVVKNSNEYYKDQLIDFYKNLSRPENIKNYKSNQRTLGKDAWRYQFISGRGCDDEDPYTHFTLDYRIIVPALLSGRYSSWDGKIDQWKSKEVINDFCVIARNLGFEVGEKEYPELRGTPYFVKMADGMTLFEFKCHKNNNVHIRMNMEFSKALNVEVSRLLGWIRTPEDIQKEFSPEMAKGAEKYFRANIAILPESIPLLISAPVERDLKLDSISSLSGANCGSSSFEKTAESIKEFMSEPEEETPSTAWVDSDQLSMFN